MNKVELIGRLTGNVEVTYTQSATPVAMLQNAIAVRRKYVKQGETDAEFFKVKAFSKTAELMANHLSKGSQVGIVGRLEVERWEKDGIKHSQVVIVVEDITFIGGKPETHQPQATTMADDEELPF
jgi:single-strand DNA-binding protein